MSPETGDEFRVDDVVGGSKRVVYTFSLLQVCNTSVEKTCLVVPWKVETMSESDDMLSSVNSNSSYSSREESESETSHEMEVVGRVQPYAEEPIAHTSDEEEDTAEDEDSLSPAVLRSRFEGQFPLNEWLVLSFCCSILQ